MHWATSQRPREHQIKSHLPHGQAATFTQSPATFARPLTTLLVLHSLPRIHFTLRFGQKNPDSGHLVSLLSNRCPRPWPELLRKQGKEMTPSCSSSRKPNLGVNGGEPFASAGLFTCSDDDKNVSALCKLSFVALAKRVLPFMRDVLRCTRRKASAHAESRSCFFDPTRAWQPTRRNGRRESDGILLQSLVLTLLCQSTDQV